MACEVEACVTGNLSGSGRGTAFAARAAAAVSLLITFGVRTLTGAQAHWEGCSPSRSQRIYFANHTSHCDFLLMLASLPFALREGTRPVAAADYWDQCALRRYLADDVFRAVPIERTGAHRLVNPLGPIIDALDRGDSLLLFPEGTRGAGEGLQPFKPGIFHVAAARPRIDLVPVWMDNAYRVMPKGSWLPIPLLCSVTFGAPAHVREHEGEEEFLRRLRDSLARLGAPRIM